MIQRKFNNQEISDLADRYNVYDSLRDGQRKAVIDIINAYQDGEKLLECPMPTASGKCEGKDTPIIMYDGSIKMIQDIIPGDVLMGPDSKPKHVLSVTSGYGPMYKVIPTWGNTFICNDKHVLNLVNTFKEVKSQGMYKLGDKCNISIEEYLNKSKNFKHHMKLWHTGVEFNNNHIIKYDPYIIGIWLGDGDKNSAIITNPDQEVINEWVKFVYTNGYDITIHQQQGAARLGMSNKNDDGSHNGYIQKDSFLNYIHTKCIINDEKRIPNEYLTNNRDVRLQVLAGLIDTDGYLANNIFYEIISKYQGLAKDIAFLANSLGFEARMKQVSKSIKSTGFTGKYYIVTIHGDISKIPCKVLRKRSNIIKINKRVPLTSAFKVEYIGLDNYYGFVLDGDGLYLHEDFLVTHNTLVGTIVAMILAKEFKHDLVLTTTPLIALADQYNNNPKYNAVMPCLIGKKNYQCGRFEGLTADDCPLKIRKDKDGEVITKLPPSCEKCEYRLAKERFDNNPMGYTTFDRFMYDPNIRGRANILIIDESASIEKKLRGYAEIELAMDCNDSNLLPWLNEKYNLLIEKEKDLTGLEEEAADNYIKSTPENRMMYFNTLKTTKKQLQKTRKELWGVGKAIGYVKEKVPYIITIDKKEKYNKDLKKREVVDVKHFKLITAEKPFEEMIKTLDFVVLMSGTPTTEQLTKEPYKVIEVEHPIPIEVRPAVFWKIGSMSFKTRDETAKKMAGIIAGIFREEKNNVIVHCGSYPVANLLYNNIMMQKGIRLDEVILQTSKTRKESLDKFLKSEHALYLSVEMAEGVDLAGEKFKVNVIANAAKPLWTDAYTIARNAYDSARKGFNQWYDQTQATMIMQAYGRTSRTPTDESITYILDSSIYSFWKRYNSIGNHKVKLFYRWFDSCVGEI